MLHVRVMHDFFEQIVQRAMKEDCEAAQGDLNRS